MRLNFFVRREDFSQEGWLAFQEKSTKHGGKRQMQTAFFKIPNRFYNKIKTTSKLVV